MATDFLPPRRARLAAALPLGDAVLVVGAGDPVPLPENSDQVYPFRAHSEYFYLTAQECAGGIVAFDPRERGDASGGWVDFVPVVTEGERVWEGRSQLPGRPATEFAAWLETRKARGVAALGAPVPEVVADPALRAKIREAFTHARRPKDAAEFEQLRRAVRATHHGYAWLRAHLRPGLTERAIQIELEAEFFRHGADSTGYHTIVGGGPNAAVLHFDPSAREVRTGEFVLVDAGAAVGRYVADVTRTFVAGTPDAFQRDLHAVVLSAQERAIACCVPGAEWKEIHLACAVELMRGLVDMDVMRGEAESLVERDAHTLFFPHGLGHMVGLGVRDGSGLLPGRAKDPRPSLRTLRMDLPLAPGYVVTVEPGLYFIPPLLNDPARRDRYRDVVNWSLVEAHLALGGVRIEDNILITDSSPENLTGAIPKTL